MIQTKILQNVEKSWWNALVSSANGEFHQTGFYAQFCTECLLKKPYYVIAEENGTPLGIAMFFLEGYGQDGVTANLPLNISKLPTRILRTLWKCCSLLHGPLILDRTREQEILEQLIETIEHFARTEKLFLWKKVMPPIHHQAFNQTVWDTCFKQYGFEHSTWATFLIDLTMSVDELWKGFKHSARKSIKKIKKEEVSFFRVVDEDGLRKYYSVLSETRERKGLQLGVRYDLLRNWWLNHAGVFQIFLVECQGKPLAGQGVFLFNNIMREVFAGTSNYAVEEKLYGGDLLKFEILKWAKESGFQLYDLAGVNPNPITASEKNIRQFKEKWGGKYIQYSVYSKVYGRARYQVLNKFRKQAHERISSN